MTENPIVSVVMTAHNGEAFIAEAIEGVLSQTLQNLELIVVDDASTDSTIAIIESYEDDRLHLIKNPENLGISNSRNIGFDAARGRYIAGHDQDDISLPTRLEKTVAILDDQPQTVLAANKSKFWSNGVVFPKEDVAPPHVMAWRLFTRSNIYTSSVCMRADALREHGLRYLQTYHYAEDYELYHRLSDIGDIVHLPEVLTIIRDHGANTSIVKQAEMDANAKSFLLKRYQDFIGASVTAEDMDLVWDVAVFGHPAESLEALARLGAILDELTEKFLNRHSLAAPQQADVLIDAAKFWWRQVSSTAQHCGPACLSLRSVFPHLATKHHHAPGVVEAMLRSIVGPLFYKVSRLF